MPIVILFGYQRPVSPWSSWKAPTEAGFVRTAKDFDDALDSYNEKGLEARFYLYGGLELTQDQARGYLVEGEAYLRTIYLRRINLRLAKHYKNATGGLDLPSPSTTLA